MAQEEAERRATPYLVLRRLEGVEVEAWTPVGEFTAYTPGDANKDAAGRDPATATEGDYWAVPVRSAKNRTPVRRRTQMMLDYADNGELESPLELEEVPEPDPAQELPA